MVESNANQIPVVEDEIEHQQKDAQGGEAKTTTTEQVNEIKQTSPKTVKLEDLEEEQEYSSDEFKELSKLYEETISDYAEGELVVGKILSIGDKEVTVDIGFKSEGTIPVDEFSNLAELNIGGDIEVFIDNVEDSEGRLVLSKKKVDFIHSWEKVLNSHDRGDILQGKCIRRIKGGIVVDLGGIDAFLPGSQIDVKPIRDFDAFIGQSLDFKVVKVNNLRKNIVVSHRVLVEEEMKEQRQNILDNLEKGQVLEGTVKNITDFGVFIDLGGVDGLLHINDLSWGRVSHPSEIVAFDETIKVMVLDYNEQKDRISLGLKQLQPHPWENVPTKYPVGSVVKGKVVNISDYGAFIELEKGVEGLIHISEMSWTQHIKHPSKILAVGEIIEAKILNVDEEGKKISLGLKQLEPDPWDTLEQKYPIGSRHDGKVRNLTNFGAFVELEEGIDGLIHISDLSWTKKVRHPGEVVKKGDSIEVVVLNVDRENRRISLGYKQTTENPWDTFEGIFKPGKITKGNTVRLIEKGVIVELPELVDGFVPISHLQKPNLTKPADGYKVGDQLELCVIEFNKEAKKIVLSEKIDYALGIIRQREQGKAVVIEDVDELFTEPLEGKKIDVQALTTEDVDEKAKTVDAEKVTESVGDQAEPIAIAVPATEIETAGTTESSVETTVEEQKITTEAEINEVKADEEKFRSEISVEETAPETPAEKAKPDVTTEIEKIEEKPKETKSKSAAAKKKDKSKAEEKKAKKADDAELATPEVAASTAETKVKKASTAEKKSSDKTEKKTTTKRSTKKKQADAE